jgi:hypothetical protein
MAEFDIKIEVVQYHDRNFSITADNETKAEEIARQLAAEQTEHLQGVNIDVENDGGWTFGMLDFHTVYVERESEEAPELELSEYESGFLTANAFVFREDVDSIGADDDWRGVHCGSRVFDLNAWDDDGVTRVTAYEVVGGKTDGNIFKRLV